MKTKLTQKQYNDAYKKLIKKSELDVDFFVLTFSAAMICILGLQVNSLGIIIGAMIISPLLYPIIAIPASILKKDYKNLANIILFFLICSTIVLLISAFVGFLFPVKNFDLFFTNEINPYKLFYFFIAIFSGLVASFSFFWPKAQEALTGIAISITILPPICMLGVSLTNNNLFFYPTLDIALLNISGIILGSFITLISFRLANKKIR
ncbi:MAG: DUF389 domain-containing protein [Candidatus Moranbacteria bacterium]|nr:DUF389 domain-containing protein [Candidatus Moranbacteria bacterium]